VRNFYQEGWQSILNDKHVAVQVVISEGLEIPHICEITLQEMCFYLAREVTDPWVKQITDQFVKAYQHRKCHTDPSAIEYCVKHYLTKVKPGHKLTCFLRHVFKHYGSIVVAWRRELGNGPTVTFNDFRRMCQTLLYREHAVQFWTELDCCEAGCLSLFDLDPKAVILLGRLYVKLMGIAKNNNFTAEHLFERMTVKIRLNRPGHLEFHEFKEALRLLGFNPGECRKLFLFMDGNGGTGRETPATVCISDIEWLKGFTNLVHVDCALMTPADAATDFEQMKLVSQGGGGAKARTLTDWSMAKKVESPKSTSGEATTSAGEDDTAGETDGKAGGGEEEEEDERF